MNYPVKIDKILVSTHKWPFQMGLFSQFKVETRMSLFDPWNVCKGEYSMNGSYDPHEVVCDKLTTAKYIRLSVKGVGGLYLCEVKVKGTRTEY